MCFHNFHVKIMLMCKQGLVEDEERDFDPGVAVVQFLSHVLLFAWTVAHQAPLSMGFPRQYYWSGLPFPSPGDLPIQGIKPHLLYWQGGFLPLSHLGSPDLGVIYL